MKTIYDKHYQTAHLFGEPYPELIAFFSQFEDRGRLLDVGCGQGRNALALANLGYEVTGIDHSTVGIDQMMQEAKRYELQVEGIVADLYEWDYSGFDHILLDNMLHFAKKDRKREIELVEHILSSGKSGVIVTFCIPKP